MLLYFHYQLVGSYWQSLYNDKRNWITIYTSEEERELLLLIKNKKVDFSDCFVVGFFIFVL
jgi:hypothetical protein